MKSRKTLAIGLVLLLLLSSLVMASPSQQPGAPAGATTIRVWSNDAHNKSVFDQLIERFNATTGTQKGINIEYTVYGADWQTAMNMAMETNREPEMFKSFTGFEDYVTAGRMLPWTEIPGVQHLLDAHAPYHRNLSSTFNGIPYGIVLYGWYSGFHYNKELLQRAGFSAPPRTWAEFEQQAIAISRLEPGRIYGYAMPLVWSPDFTTWMTEYFAASSIGNLYWDFTNGRTNFASFTPYFEMLSRIRDAGAMFPGMETLSDDQQRAYFADGRIGFIGGAGWNVGVLYDQFPFGGGVSGRPNNPTGWDYAPMPVQNLNQVYATPISAGVYQLVSAQVRNDRAKLNAMADVIEVFHGDATQMIMFTQGYHVPVREDIAARAAPAERVQWSTYGQVAGRTVTMPSSPISRLAVEGPDRVAVIGQILTGQIPIPGIRAALEDLDRRTTAAFEQAVSRNQLNRADYLDPTFEQRFRGR